MSDAKSAPCNPNTFHLHILSEHAIVRSRCPWMIPSHVCMPSLLFTGIVPSPDSIFVRKIPRAFRLGCLSIPKLASSSWGLNIRASPHGAVFIYKWKFMPSFKRYN